MEQPNWYSNTVAFRHSNGTRANFVMVDRSVTSASYMEMESQEGRERIFFHDRGESLNAFQ